MMPFPGFGGPQAASLARRGGAMVIAQTTGGHDVMSWRGTFALDIDRAPLVSLRRRLAAGRGPVICDFSPIERLDPDLAAAIVRLNREVGWPDAGLVVAGAFGEVKQTFDDIGAFSELLAFPDVSTALATVAVPAPPLDTQLRLPPSAVSVRTARLFVRRQCRAWSVLLEITEDALVVVTELLTNALVHAGTDCELLLELTARSFSVAVGDGLRRELPAITDERPGDEAGRGLRVVNRLSRAWGYEEVEYGKQVWASLARGAGGPLIN